MALTPEQRAEIRARYVGWDVCDLVQEIVDLHDGAEVERLTAENNRLRGRVASLRTESRHQEVKLALARQRNEAELAGLCTDIYCGCCRAARRALTGQDRSEDG